MAVAAESAADGWTLLTGVGERRALRHEIHVEQTSLFTCSCGRMERWPERWQAVAAAYEYGRAARRSMRYVVWGAKLWG